MNKFKQLIGAINALLNASNQTDSEANRKLAADYAQACSVLKNRIEKCMVLIEEAKMAEAARIANATPDLWESARSLNLAKRSAWYELCEFYDWEVPEDISKSHLTYIQQELASGRELAPMLNYYRARIHKLSVSEKVTILRKIRSLDSGNPQWNQDLLALESEYIKDLMSRAKEAIINHNTGDLEAVYAEFTSPEIKQKVDTKVLEGCKKKIDEFNGAALKRKGNDVLLQVDNAYAMQEREELEQALKIWDEEVENDKYFAFADLSLERLKAPRKWLAEEKLKLEEEIKYKKAIKDFSAAMDNNEDIGVLETMFFNLGTFDEGVPQELHIRYNNFVENYERAKVRRFIIKLTFSIASVIIVAISIWWAIGHFQYEKKHKRYLAQFSALLKDKAVDEAENVFEKLKKREPDIYASPEIQVILHDFTELRKKETLRRADLDRYLKILESLAEDNFADEKRFQDTLQQAAPFVVRQNEKTRFNAIKDSYNEYLSDKREKQEAEFTIEVNNILSLISDFDKNADSDDERKFATQYNLLERKIAGLTKYSIDSAKIQKAVITLKEKMMDIKIRHEDLLKYRKAMIDSVKQIAETIKKNNLRALKKQIQDFLKIAGPKGEDSIYAKALSNYPLVENLTSLARYNTKSVTGITALWQEVKDIGSKNNPWYIPAEQLAKASSKASSSKINAMLQRIKYDSMKYYQIKFINNKGDTYCYYSAKRPQKVSSGAGTNMSAQILTADKKTSPASFKMQKGVWQISQNFQVYSIPGYKFRNSYVPEYKEAWDTLIQASSSINYLNVETVFIDWIEKTAKDPQINPLIKYRLLLRAADVLSQVSTCSDEINEYIENLKPVKVFSLKNNLTFLNLTPEQFRGINIMIADAPLDKLRTLANNYSARNSILKDILGVQLKWAGMIIESDGKPLAVIGLNNSLAQEVWMLEVKTPPRITFKRIGFTQQGKFTPSVPLNELIAGSYLFCPKAGFNTKILAEAIKKRFNAKYIVWPDLWPVNCR